MQGIKNVEQWLGNDNQIGIDIWNKKYRHNNETFNEWIKRISGGDDELQSLILGKKFLFGGRALSNRGINDGSSMFNCYSSGYCPDNLNGIMKLNTDLALTYKAQGGQGVSLSKIRPKGTPIGTRYESDGIIPFLELFNQTTAAISQGSSRKGALMVSLDIRHKEAKDFIKIKSGDNKISKANLSLEIDDEFMEAVKAYYKKNETITFHERKIYNGHVVEYEIIPIDIYKMLVKECYDWADPACLFTNRFRNYNIMEFDDEYEVETSNPCGEQPLKKNSCCNLGSLNLSEFVLNPYTLNSEFDYQSFKSAISIAVEALDVLIDENAENHAILEQKENSLNYRNIGLGCMGYGTMLFKLGLTYGSEKAKMFTDKLFEILFKTAVYSSNNLARQKGKFPKYKDVVWKSKIMKKHFSENEIIKLKEYGLRNCSLISVAPTGSIATMLGVTGGCEPEFAIKYQRKTESLDKQKEKYYEINCNALVEYQTVNQTYDIPNYFVSALDINWKDRIKTQAIMQNHVDTAISSTVNLQKSTTIEDVEQLYIYAWEQGLKGVTIYRSGCKRAGILSTDDISTSSQNAFSSKFLLQRGDIIHVNDDVIGKKRKIITGCGSLHCIAFFDPISGDLLETYFSKGSEGGCVNFATGLSRIISYALRSGANLQGLLDQLESCGTCPSYAVRKATKKDTSKGSSCPIAICNALKDMYHEVQNEIILIEAEEDDPLQTIKTSNYICPECDEELIFEGGCNTCKSCGWSKCD